MSPLVPKNIHFQWWLLSSPQGLFPFIRPRSHKKCASLWSLVNSLQEDTSGMASFQASMCLLMGAIGIFFLLDIKVRTKLLITTTQDSLECKKGALVFHELWFHISEPLKKYWAACYSTSNVLVLWFFVSEILRTQKNVVRKAYHIRCGVTFYRNWKRQLDILRCRFWDISNSPMPLMYLLMFLIVNQ